MKNTFLKNIVLICLPLIIFSNVNAMQQDKAPIDSKRKTTLDVIVNREQLVRALHALSGLNDLIKTRFEKLAFILCDEQQKEREILEKTKACKELSELHSSVCNTLDKEIITTFNGLDITNGSCMTEIQKKSMHLPLETLRQNILKINLLFHKELNDVQILNEKICCCVSWSISFLITYKLNMVMLDFLSALFGFHNDIGYCLDDYYYVDKQPVYPLCQKPPFIDSEYAKLFRPFFEELPNELKPTIALECWIYFDLYNCSEDDYCKINDLIKLGSDLIFDVRKQIALSSALSHVRRFYAGDIQGVVVPLPKYKIINGCNMLIFAGFEPVVLIVPVKPVVPAVPVKSVVPVMPDMLNVAQQNANCVNQDSQQLCSAAKEQAEKKSTYVIDEKTLDKIRMGPDTSYKKKQGSCKTKFKHQRQSKSNSSKKVGNLPLHVKPTDEIINIPATVVPIPYTPTMKSENNPNHEISENKLQDMGKSVAVCQPNNNDVVRSVEERQHVTSKIDDAEKLYNNINDVNDKILQKLKKIQEMQDKCSNVDMLYKSKCYVIRNLLEQHETLKSRIIPPYDKDFIIRTIICSVSTALERSCMIAARQDIFLSEDILDSLSEDISNTVDLGDDFLKELNADLKNVLMKAKELNDDCSDSELPKCQEYAGCVNTQLENNKMFKIKPKKEPWLPFLGCTIL